MFMIGSPISLKTTIRNTSLNTKRSDVREEKSLEMKLSELKQIRNLRQKNYEKNVRPAIFKLIDKELEKSQHQSYSKSAFQFADFSDDQGNQQVSRSAAPTSMAQQRIVEGIRSQSKGKVRGVPALNLNSASFHMQNTQ